jgi:hypothetical protein
MTMNRLIRYNNRRWKMMVALVAAIAAASCTDSPVAPNSASAGAAPQAAGAASVAGGRPAATGVIFVTSQQLYYDTFVTNDPLPMKGKFQLLENGRTEFGPGDPGYLGGRWWEDLNHNGVQDTGDHFFHCPLLPPGRPTP